MAEIRQAHAVDDSADCEDQALVPTVVCVNWKCRSPRLIKTRQGRWVCPTCGGSYGKDAKGWKG